MGPKSTFEQFEKAVTEGIQYYSQNLLLKRLASSDIRISDYHNYLLAIFHQTYQAPSTFALAGAHCDLRQFKIRDYLIKHAEEERAHWEWVIEDLQNTGYTGPDPRNTFPDPACQSFIAFNLYLAIRHPISRLGTAAVLEGIGASYGRKTAETLIRQVGLKENQMKFIFGHGDTDVGHTKEIFDLLRESHLSEYDWAFLCHAAKTSSRLYRAMYDEASAGDNAKLD
jgi:hypothetical protein